MNLRQYLSIISISPTLFAITWKVWEVQPETLKLSSELMHQIQTRCSLSAGPDTGLDAWLEAAKLHEARFSVAHFPEESDLTDVTHPLSIERVVLLLLLLLLKHHHERPSSPVTARGNYRHEEEVGVNKGQMEKPCATYSGGNTMPHHVFSLCKTQTLFTKGWLAFTVDVHSTVNSSGSSGEIN